MFFVERTGGWRRRRWRIGVAPRAGGGLRGPMSGIALGAGLMYLLDPRRGAGRRAIVKSWAAHAVRAAEGLLDSGARDLEQRARGAVAAVTGRLRRDDADDEVVALRVRAALGRYTAHAHAIAVEVHDGEAQLTGPVLSSEWQGIVDGVKRVRGVRRVSDRLEAHASAEGVSALRGGARAEAGSGAVRNRWAPGTRLVAGGAGVYLLVRGVLGGGLLGLPAAIAGVALLARAAATGPVGRGAAGGAEIHLRKSIHVERPVDEVYAFFTKFENLPRFMSHVREVRATGENRTRWIVDGPGGVPVAWEAVTTAQEPNRLVAWESERGSVVRTAGMVRFEEAEGGRTRMDVTLRYHPPAGTVGHVIARLLGADPKRQMDDDLIRLKSLLERGKATGREGSVTLDDLRSADAMAGSPRGAAPPQADLEEAARDERTEASRREPSGDGG